MQIRISTDDGVPIYQQIVSQVKFLAASGRLEVGEKLPPVRKLAEQLLINPNTVARAYRELESQRIVNSRQGSGVYVADTVSPFSRREQNRILSERIDALLTEAAQLDIDLSTLIKLVRKRSQALKEG